MRLAIDARFTRTDHHDGISRYGASMIEAVSEHADVLMLISDERQLALLPDLPWVRINSPLSPAELFVARRINRLGADAVFCPMQTMGSWGRKYPLILTLHDLIYYQNPAPPSFLPLPVRALWRLYHLAYWPQRLLLNRADVVATISETTRALMEQHRLTRRPVRILANAPQPGAVPRTADAPAEPSLLYMGSFMPYKNVETVIRGMEHLPGFTLHLLSRISDARRTELEALVPAGAQVRFHNGVTDEEYDHLLRRATALVTLSKAEGYGLPVIESMAVGTPVVASDIPIFREVSGGAALLVDPDDPAAFAGAVRELAVPERWQKASDAGLQRAGDYGWAASARQLMAAAGEAVRLFPGRRRRR
ncbi:MULTISPECIES: glycosyltransferase family 4 protein [unclassified Arthrobacter]|uniref:glycosyltransferase family 4 protein n=1 Tax=unclassified Arthrobacter TaxID=235627 RepID=UPI001D13E04C|nr:MULTISPECIES: glycosyltransferase family 1 protein [unclassified Arthrobacter]MCC3274849.1 glycosyltransferase family 4 protein [Arthrobacter sp. zg-Y20]MCC3279180.1 glycosyltransferase family 4 protein [Arthrobacter sp. zg-Y40]MCC9177557.1 glycosyltransferase family 4 protein [Arthrobacter sp. zg-Y750]MDK1315005.1 glycosyltransferase family 1 protein [Arthrobacter sp. zg.Y20]WIB07830.1 glycosyltransferase family 1 protein [Arthrobacter sp. zg-Y20]